MADREGWWRQGDGSWIRIRDMGDRHLCNSIRFAQRSIEAAHQVATVVGDIDDAWMETRVVESNIEDMSAKQDELIAEARRRGLRW